MLSTFFSCSYFYGSPQYDCHCSHHSSKSHICNCGAEQTADDITSGRSHIRHPPEWIHSLNELDMAWRQWHRHVTDVWWHTQEEGYLHVGPLRVVMGRPRSSCATYFDFVPCLPSYCIIFCPHWCCLAIFSWALLLFLLFPAPVYSPASRWYPPSFPLDAWLHHLSRFLSGEHWHWFDVGFSPEVSVFHRQSRYVSTWSYSIPLPGLLLASPNNS